MIDIPVYVDQESADKVVAKLKRLKLDVKMKIVSKGVGRAARIIARYARKNAPVRTGALRRAIRVRVSKKNRRNIHVQKSFVLINNRKYDRRTTKYNTAGKFRAGRASVHYGHIVEGRRPFLAPALHAHTQQAVAALYETIDKELKKLWAN